MFISSFDLQQYNALYNNLTPNTILNVHLPKFELKANQDMRSILIDIGMTNTFQSADLRRMGDFSSATAMSRVLHDVSINVDETGIEGSAVTTVSVNLVSGLKDIKFNRPFLFIVRHVETNLPVFIGRVGNPLQ